MDWTSYVEDEDDPHVGAWLDRVRDGMQAAGDALTGAAWNPETLDPFGESFAGRAGYCLLTLQVGRVGAALVAAGRPVPGPGRVPAGGVRPPGALVRGVAGDGGARQRHVNSTTNEHDDG